MFGMALSWCPRSEGESSCDDSAGYSLSTWVCLLMCVNTSRLLRVNPPPSILPARQTNRRRLLATSCRVV